MTIQETSPIGPREVDGDTFVGRRVMLLLWDRHMTQTGLARQLGITQGALSLKLRGVRGWTVDNLRETAIALGTSVAYLVGEVESPVVPPEGFEPSAFCSHGELSRAVTSAFRTIRLRSRGTMNRPPSLSNGDDSNARFAPVYYLPAPAGD
ncbi:MAG: helix-turn-helix domain-containing protein [Promicromonosporaceae bacterium]|nr:helix-turn-helix domain-containing protein [Promicromonosporaceae bacterium]